MKTLRKVFLLGLFLGLILSSTGALAGESGTVTCSTPGCGYQHQLIIGGGRKSPAVTGYCRSTKEFVRLKLNSWADYRKPHNCPGSGEKMQPIYQGSQVSQIPCPQCGHLSLHYKRRILFD